MIAVLVILGLGAVPPRCALAGLEPPPALSLLAATPARLPGDPPAPQLPDVPDRGPQVPAPLPRDENADRFALGRPFGLPAGSHESLGSLAPRVDVTQQELLRFTVLPGITTVAGMLTPFALGARGGDWGTPAVEQLAAYGGGYLGTAAAIGGTALIEALGPAPRPEIGVNRGALGFAALAVPLFTPAAAGVAAWASGEGMQGRSLHPTENLFAAMGGGLAGELLYVGASIALHQPAATTNFVFVPIAIGSTLAYDLARGPHRGPRRAEMPLLILRF